MPQSDQTSASRGKQMAVLATIAHEKATDPKIGDLIDAATKDLNEDILLLRKWFAANKLTVKTSKCELSTFATKSVPNLENSSSEEIPNKNSAK